MYFGHVAQLVERYTHIVEVVGSSPAVPIKAPSIYKGVFFIGRVWMEVPFFLHNLGEGEIHCVLQVLQSPFLTTGKVTQTFEERFSKYLGVKYAVGVTNGTTALFLALKALGIGQGDEVVTTPLSFIATANAILHTGATPVFVDVDARTGNLREDLVEKVLTERTKAILPVHLYGQMVDMRKLLEIAKKYDLFLVEDSAHAIEAEREGYRPAQLSEAACFSFYATKNITSGEGGAIATKDEEFAERLRKLRLHGMTKGALDRYQSKYYQHYDMVLLGYKANMKDIDAALLLPQLERIEELWKRREEIARRYEEAFSQMEEVDFPKVLPNSKSARHLFTLWVSPKKRDEILWRLAKQGVGCTVNYRPIHLMSFYRKNFGYQEGMFPEAERIGSSTITLPLYPRLTDEQVEYVIQAVKQAIWETK